MLKVCCKVCGGQFGAYSPKSIFSVNRTRKKKSGWFHKKCYRKIGGESLAARL